MRANSRGMNQTGLVFGSVCDHWLLHIGILASLVFLLLLSNVIKQIGAILLACKESVFDS